MPIEPATPAMFSSRRLGSLERIATQSSRDGARHANDLSDQRHFLHMVGGSSGPKSAPISTFAVHSFSSELMTLRGRPVLGPHSLPTSSSASSANRSGCRTDLRRQVRAPGNPIAQLTRKRADISRTRHSPAGLRRTVRLANRPRCAQRTGIDYSEALPV